LSPSTKPIDVRDLRWESSSRYAVSVSDKGVVRAVGDVVATVFPTPESTDSRFRKGGRVSVVVPVNTIDPSEGAAVIGIAVSAPGRAN